MGLAKHPQLVGLCFRLHGELAVVPCADFRRIIGNDVEATAVFEVPTLRRCQLRDVPLAQLAGAGIGVLRRIEPHRALPRVERERRGGDRAAAGTSALALHTATVLACA